MAGWRGGGVAGEGHLLQLAARLLERPLRVGGGCGRMHCLCLETAGRQLPLASVLLELLDSRTQRRRRNGGRNGGRRGGRIGEDVIQIGIWDGIQIGIWDGIRDGISGDLVINVSCHMHLRPLGHTDFSHKVVRPPPPTRGAFSRVATA